MLWALANSPNLSPGPESTVRGPHGVEFHTVENAFRDDAASLPTLTVIDAFVSQSRTCHGCVAKVHSI